MIMVSRLGHFCYEGGGGALLVERINIIASAFMTHRYSK